MKGIKKVFRGKSSASKQDGEKQGKKGEPSHKAEPNPYVQPQRAPANPRNPYLHAEATSKVTDGVYAELQIEEPIPPVPPRTRTTLPTADSSTSLQRKEPSDWYQAVVAIDFGTAASGYSYSYARDKDDIKMNKNWGAEMGVGSYKAPTCIAIRSSDKQFCGFGYTAQNMYIDDPDANELYREFKMQLAGQGTVGRTMVVKNDYRRRKSDSELPAVTVFSMALRFLKDHFLNVLADSAIDIEASRIRWVLTVPALWTDEQKYFMREVATEAGLIRTPSSDQLIIALEPECASLYCRTIKAHLFEGESGNTAMELPVGSQYMVLDCGGGTIDITVHKVTGPQSSEEMFQPSGLTVGGTNINKNFELLMEKIFGKEFIEYCLQTEPSVWLELLVDFEQKKKNVTSQFGNHIDIQLRMGFSECFSQYHKGQSIKDYLHSLGSDKVSFVRGGKIRIQPKALKDDIFDPIIRVITSHLKKLFQQAIVKKVQTVFIVGGFGQCKCLQEEVRMVFDGHEVRVLIPEEPSLCVLKGAVKFGHRPDFISSRVSRWTYALKVSRAFQADSDAPERKVDLPGCAPYVEFLTPIVVRGQSVKLNTVYKKVVQPRIPEQTEVDLAIYSSTEAQVDNPKAPEVKCLGDVTVTVPISSNISDRQVTLRLIFGGTELKVTGNNANGDTVETRLNLLH